MFESAGLLSAWLLGVSLGLTACTVSCLPFMGAWVLARQRAVVMADTRWFLAGRVSAYTLLGWMAGLSGARLTAELQSGIGHIAIGIASLAAGVGLLLGQPSPRLCAPRRRANAPPFALGFALSLTPCAPLASLLAFAAQSGSGMLGLSQGLAFGLGTALTPLLLLLPLVSAFGARLQAQRHGLGLWLQRGAGFVLIVLGGYRLSVGWL